jgi:peptidase E
MKRRPPTIVALGGGGFSMEDDPRLDEYVLAASGADRPRVTFLPTASRDAAEYTERFHAAFGRLGARTAHLDLPEKGSPSAPGPGRVEARLRDQDVIYVGGGNTMEMLRTWRAYDLPSRLREMWAAGVVLAGVSAGALCWFEGGVTDSIPGRMTPLACLGFLPGTFCPHYDGEVQRRPAYEALIADSTLASGIGVDDSCAVCYRGRERIEVVASVAGAAARLVDVHDGGVRERRLPARLLPPCAPDQA